MGRTIEVKQKKPGRPPKWREGTISKHYFLPKSVVDKLKKGVQEGKFNSETEGITYYVLYADKLDELLDELQKLKRKLEVLEAENEALRNKIKLVGEQKDAEIEELKRRYHELLKDHEEVVKELMSFKAHGESKESKKTGKELWVLVDEYLKAKEESLKAKTQREADEAERRKSQLTNEIFSILDSLGIDKVEFWKTLNLKGLDEAKKLVGGG